MNTDQIINRAICYYRGAKADESRALFDKACEINRDQSRPQDMAYILLDKATRAAEESHAAHEALGVTFANPCDCMSGKQIAFWREKIGTKAEEAYARAEAEIEARNNQREDETLYGVD